MPSKTQIAVTVAALQATLRPALALLPSEVKGSAAAGWLHLEDWMYATALKDLLHCCIAVVF